MSEKPKWKPGGAPKIINLADVVDKLRARMDGIDPEDSTQRKAFKICMPELYVLRERGCSWDQITKLLNEIGVNLLTSTVRTYYGEMLADQMNKCQDSMSEFLLLQSKARKIAASEEEETRLAALVQKNIQRRREAAAKFGVKYVGYEDLANSGKGQSVAESKMADSSTPGKVTGSTDTANGAVKVPSKEGVIGTGGQEASLDGSKGGEDGGFFGAKAARIVDDVTNTDQNLKADQVNSVSKIDEGSEQTRGLQQPQPTRLNNSDNVPAPVGAGAPDKKQNWKCLPLQPGVGRLERSDGVPENVYREGDLEHPAIPGLMLTLEQRLSKAMLEMVNTETGETRTEGVKEKSFRMKWKKPIPVTRGRTSSDFVRDYSNSW